MTGPVGITSKQRQRIENKKKKMAALLDIVRLNENDRQKGKNVTKMEPIEVGDHCDRISVEAREDTGQSPNKKLRTESFGVDIGPSGKPLLEGDELAVLKKALREKTNKIRQSPKFWLREMGENATLKVPLESRCPLFLSDIQHLLMYSQIGVHSPYSPARWCNLEKYNKLANVTLLIVDNVSLYHYEAFESCFPFTSLNFDHKLEIISPFSFHSDVVKELSMVPLSSTQMRRLIQEYGSLDDAVKNCDEIFDTIKNFFPINQDSEDSIRECDSSLPKTDTFSRTKLLLSGWQMVEENFPLPIKGLVERKYADYVLTKDTYKSVSPHSPLLAIDCEMCKTVTGELELTRISVVNEKHEVLYDTLVKPDNRIADYLTRFSGINAKMMKNVTTKLKDVQATLKNLLPDDAILVGQSLSNDLHALKMMHPYIIDTSVIYNISGDRTRKTKLQTLAREFLEEKIQVGNHGHCSSEDSLACMKLVQLKLRKHLYYGDAVINSKYTEQRAYPDMATPNFGISMLKECTKAGNTANVIGVENLAEVYKFYVNKNNQKTVANINFSKVNSNRKVIKHLCETMSSHNLNIGHLSIASDQVEEVNADRSRVFTILDRWISEIYNACVKPALVAVILSGNKEGGNGACFLHLKRDFIS